MNTCHLTEVQKSYIVNEVAKGTKQEYLAQIFKVSRKTIYRVLVERGVIVPRYQDKMLQLLKKHNISYQFLKELLEG